MNAVKMSSRERLTAALRRQPVDRLPWTVDLGYYNTALRIQHRFDSRYEGMEGYLRQHEELGADPYFSGAPGVCRMDLGDVKRAATESASECTTAWTLDGRTLKGIERYLPESFCWAWSRHPVETVEELELFLRMARRFRLTPDVERHRAAQQACGERALLICGLPRNPVAAMLAEWCGVMAASYLIADAPDAFSETLGVLERLTDPLFDALCVYRPAVVHFCDNISGETVGSFWDRFMLPLYRRRLKPLQEAGIVCVIHNDGTVGSVLGRIAAAGFDGAEALTPAPVGDVAPGDLRRLAGRDDFVLWGMVPGAMFAPFWSEADFRAHVERVLRECSGPMVLGSADQIPPGADLRRVRIVHEILTASSR